MGKHRILVVGSQCESLGPSKLLLKLCSRLKPASKPFDLTLGTGAKPGRFGCADLDTALAKIGVHSVRWPRSGRIGEPDRISAYRAAEFDPNLAFINSLDDTREDYTPPDPIHTVV